MLRSALIFLAAGLVGWLIVVTGMGGIGSCGPYGAGLLATILILVGLPIGAILLTIVGARAGWRRWKQHRSQATLELKPR